MSVSADSGAQPSRSAGGFGARVARGLIYLIELYRHMVSPLRPATCRFIPTCSQYAVEALAEYGVFRGSWLTVARLAKCGPWHRGGWDPIPEPFGDDQEHRAAGCPDSDLGWHSPAKQGERGPVV